MQLSDFYYELPPSLIAQKPLAERDRSRLMVLRPSRREIRHHSFFDIVTFLNAGDVLVLNNTKVFPARLLSRKPTGGKVEILLLRNIGENDWEALVHPSGKFKKGAVASIDQNGFSVEALDSYAPESGHRTVRLHNRGEVSVQEKINEHGHIPLPPYIKRSDTAEDAARYQTVFADKTGAVAAPTAGLHFTPALLAALQKKGIQIVYVTLHVGYGTFKPVTAEQIEEHRMHAESFSVTNEVVEKINRRTGRLIACGTTALRSLEAAADTSGKIQSISGETNLFIYPGYKFKTADALITNFHLPHSTLLMLVSAFAGREFVMSAYEEAKLRGYRFYSYGDAMLIEKQT